MIKTIKNANKKIFTKNEVNLSQKYEILFTT